MSDLVKAERTVASGEVLDTMTVADLRELNEKVWSADFMAKEHKLSHKQWAAIQQTIIQERLACQMVNCGMGFQIGMDLWEAPQNPGLPNEPVLRIEGNMLPGYTRGAPASWNWTFKTLSPFTHSDRNKEILEFCGIEAPQEQSHYEY